MKKNPTALGPPISKLLAAFVSLFIGSHNSNSIVCAHLRFRPFAHIL
ncbi:hypothetical protein XYCOK13_09180 [Xylanibacillus composti]|uniref:Uncharacterized protein n=1 Tax=Xylanibacillus composti TaxID=1572762 RepID=A0A8J4H386_9BACL|nr:hypothetical protein XYCOK13_09180 [Xylanibacillus composti]